MTIRVQAAAFDPWEELTSYERSARERLAGKTGGAAVFVGSMRDFNQGQTVRAMTLEHYPGMTVNYLEKVEAEARTRWPLLDCLVIHRYGPLQPGDPIVLVAAWAMTDLVPQATLGTFWMSTPTTGRYIDEVLAYREDVEKKREARTIDELLRANIGKRLRILRGIKHVPSGHDYR